MTSGNDGFSASWREMVGIALLWVSLACLVALARAEAQPWEHWISVAGFGAFALGLLLFAEGLKRGIAAAVARNQRP